ncbi:glycosyltransferase family A protein [Azorhizobium doebereinerae]|uniref:glycosyltransferase family A protein n=1 Tax=Azorhizobium doebereinerae TaxID=281091 RepID=UPI0006876B74|nr:glycosyltransferase family A protein [Azorhizobium doebereinerae]
MSDTPLSFRVVAPPRRVLVAPKAIVAIPVKDEETRLMDCLAALAAQRDAPDFATIVLLHNCVDRTEQVAVAAGETLPLPLRILSIDLPPDRDGAAWARRHVMDAAASLFVTSGMPDGAILTTEADARAAPNWVAANLAALARGADAVAGRVEMDAAESLPAPLWRRYQAAQRYARLISDIDHRIDPDPENPWPVHREASSASLAVQVGPYVKAGGIPTLAAGSGRALVTALRRGGCIVRHDPAAQVSASWRIDAGGIGARFRAWSEGQSMQGTLELEPVAQVVRRARLRRTLRKAHATGQLWSVTNWAGQLRISAIDAFKLAALPGFPQIWATLEGISPLLTPHPLAPAQLTLETARAMALIAEMRLRAGLRQLTGRSGPDDGR